MALQVVTPEALDRISGVSQSFYAPRCSVALSYTVIRLSHGAAALGYRHTACLQLSHHWPPEVCRLQTCPQMDLDPLESNCHQRGHIVSPPLRQ